MRKIIQNPLVDVVLTFLIAYLVMYKSWFVGDFLLITLPNILGIDLQSIMGEDLYITWIEYISFISIWICGLVIIALFKGYRPILKVFSVKCKGNNIKSVLLLGLALGFCLNLILALLAITTGALKIHYVGLGMGSSVLLFIAVLVQSGAEELVARGFIYQRLRKDFPKWSAIAILGNGLFFLAIHIGNPGMTVISTLNIILVSIMYSLVIYYFDSVWISIIAHTTWNFTQNIVLGLPNSGIVFPISIFKIDAGTKNFAYDPVFGIEGTVLTLVILCLADIGLYFLGRKKGAAETNIWTDTNNVQQIQ